MNECPQCGSTFNTKQGMRSHHAQVHNESISGFEYTCDWCGETDVREKKETNNKRCFCSKECYSQWRSETITGKNHPSWEGGKVVVECEWCDKQHKRHKSVVQKTERVFCDQNCQGKWRVENQTMQGKNHPAYSQRESECKYCGNTVMKSKSKAKREKFCSRECYHNYYSETYVGEDNIHWKEDSKELAYGGGWRRKRRKRLERDSYECVVCGKSNAQEKADTGMALNVHHIEKARNFLQDDGSINKEMAHRMENLITLCNSCHTRWEGIPLKPDIRGKRRKGVE
jgi:hypothetical protein